MSRKSQLSPLASLEAALGPAIAPQRLPLAGFASSVLGLDLSERMRQIMRDADAPHIRTVAVRAGARGGKTSRLLASKALHAAWTLPLETLAPGEPALALLVAPDKRRARQALGFVVGLALESPSLRAHVEGDPTADRISIRRPDSKLVSIEVMAAVGRGLGGRGFTLVFAGLDEACLFRDERTGAVNDTEQYDAVMPRLVPGGQCWVVSTPWIAKTGLLEELMVSDDPSVYAASATTRELNPTWDPDGSIERIERARDPDKARREIDAIPLNSSAVNFFDAALIERCTDASLTIPRIALPGEYVAAGGDFGFRSDSSAVIVVHADHAHIRVGDLLELRPEHDKPLVPSEAIRTMATQLRKHAGLRFLVADAHYQETVTEHLAGSGLGYVPAPLDVADVYVRARALMREGRVRLPNHHRLLSQLRSVQWRPNPGGSISIVLPRERGGGHCDLVSALVLALYQTATVSVPAPHKEPTVAAFLAAEAQRQAQRSPEELRLEKAAERRMLQRKESVW